MRKEILKRNHAETTYLPDTIDYESFRKLDCMKVLQLLVSNDQVKTVIYNELFGKVVPSTSTILNRRGGTRSSRHPNPCNTSHPVILHQP